MNNPTKNDEIFIFSDPKNENDAISLLGSISHNSDNYNVHILMDFTEVFIEPTISIIYKRKEYFFDKAFKCPELENILSSKFHSEYLKIREILFFLYSKNDNKIYKLTDNFPVIFYGNSCILLAKYIEKQYKKLIDTLKDTLKDTFNLIFGDVLIRYSVSFSKIFFIDFNLSCSFKENINFDHYEICKIPIFNYLIEFLYFLSNINILYIYSTISENINIRIIKYINEFLHFYKFPDSICRVMKVDYSLFENKEYSTNILQIIKN